MQEIRGGILRVNELVLKMMIIDFFTGKSRIVNPGLKLWGIRRKLTDFNLSFDEYEISFSADDLPLLKEGCYPSDVELKAITKADGYFELVEA